MCGENGYRIMKILIVSTSVVPLGGNKYGGIEKLCYDFVEQLNKRGHQVSVAAPIGSSVPAGVELINTVKLPEQQDRDDLALDYRFIRDSKTLGDYNIIHDFSHGHQYARKTNLPVVSMLWDPVVHAYPKAPYNMVCLSNWQRERFEKKYNQKAIVMPMMVDTDKYKPDPNAKRERFLFLGKISQEKGVHKAIEYAKELKVPLDVVGGLIPSEEGSQYLKSIQIMVDRARYQENHDIQLYYNVTEDMKIRFLQNAKAVIYPVQQDEAQWLVGIEAWACGTPTIALDRGALNEIGFEVCRNEDEFKGRMFHYYHEDNVIEDWPIQKYGFGAILQWEALYRRVSDGERW